jgi:hypothetical protein
MEYLDAAVNVGFDGEVAYGHNAGMSNGSAPASRLAARDVMQTPGLENIGAGPRARLIGRRVGIVLYAVLFGGATVLWSVQILMQVWGGAPPSALGCGGGTDRLEAALLRARSQLAGGAALQNERAALETFRGALEPEWSERREIEAACRGDELGERRLRDIIALRYAEEHAVRYESLGLAPLRRRVKSSHVPRTEPTR